jgi:hypothetical protein
VDNSLPGRHATPKMADRCLTIHGGRNKLRRCSTIITTAGNHLYKNHFAQAREQAFYWSKFCMELRKDPITQSWIILGQREITPEALVECPFDVAAISKLMIIFSCPAEGTWQV